MNLEMIQYFQINLLGVLLLLILLYSSIHTRQSHVESDTRYFQGLLVCNLLILFADCGIYLLRWNSAPGAIVLCHFFCLLYFLLHPIFGIFWLRYTLKRLYPEFVVTGWVRAAFIGPLAVALAALFSSPVTGFVYHLTKQNRYVRGDFLPLYMLFCYSYWLISLLLVLHEIRHPDRLRDRWVYRVLLLFPLPTLIGNLLQYLFYGLTIVWVCSAFSLLILFIYLQSQQISRDALSGLFNRGQTNRQLLWEINHRSGATDLLFAVMLDVDRFKSINDRFGHLAGDQAILEIASLLHHSFRSNDFIGRFGGDEFFVLGHVQTKKELEALLARLNQNIEALNATDKLPYRLTLSAGFSLYGPDCALTLDQVIADADAHMYQTKIKKAEDGTLC